MFLFRARRIPCGRITRRYVSRISEQTQDPAHKEHINRVVSGAIRKREGKAVKHYQENYTLVDQYLKHHKKVLDIADNSKIVQSMFSRDSKLQTTTYKNLEHILGSLSYTNVDMKSTILLISHSLLESISIEERLKSKGIPELHNSTNLKYAIDHIKESSWFNSLEQYRYKFHHYKSGQYLNYWKSDTTPAILGEDYIRFHSTAKDSSEYINRFDSAFDKYQKDSNHIALGQKIVQALIQCNKNTPTLEIWTYLLSQFQRFGLYNFATIVYLSLFHYKHQTTVLAKHPEQLTAPLMPDHFSHLILAHPDILGPIFTYQARNQDVETAVDLLAFLQLDQVIKERHPYMWSRSGIHLIRIPQSIFLAPELTISRQCVYAIMKACLDLNLHAYFGLLFDKILVDSQDSNTVKLNTGSYKLVENIFDEELCLLWIEYCKRTIDSRAVGWLLTYFLPQYLQRQNGQFSDKFKAEFKEMMELCDYERRYQELQKQYSL